MQPALSKLLQSKFENLHYQNSYGGIMFDNKKNDNENSTPDVFRPAKGSASVVIGEGVEITGEVKKSETVQIDGNADLVLKTDNLVVGATGKCKGNIETHNADIFGDFNGDLKASGTLTIQEQGSISGSIEYQNIQIKLGGKLSGDIKLSEKIQPIKKEIKEDDISKTSMQNALKKEDK